MSLRDDFSFLLEFAETPLSLSDAMLPLPSQHVNSVSCLLIVSYLYDCPRRHLVCVVDFYRTRDRCCCLLFAVCNQTRPGFQIAQQHDLEGLIPMADASTGNAMSLSCLQFSTVTSSEVLARKSFVPMRRKQIAKPPAFPGTYKGRPCYVRDAKRTHSANFPCRPGYATRWVAIAHWTLTRYIISTPRPLPSFFQNTQQQLLCT